MPFFFISMAARAEGIDKEDGDDYIFVIDIVFVGSETKAIEKVKREMRVKLQGEFPDVRFDTEAASKSSMFQWYGLMAKR